MKKLVCVCTYTSAHMCAHTYYILHKDPRKVLIFSPSGSSLFLNTSYSLSFTIRHKPGGIQTETGDVQNSLIDTPLGVDAPSVLPSALVLPS